jgi:SP family galactose:H+ symporter-like MFS transporter
MLGVLLIPSALMFLGVSMLPKSPRWLAMRKRKDEAVAVLTKLRSSVEEVENEFKDIEERLKEEPKSGINMLKEKPYRKVIILGIILQAAQQFTGMNVIMYYAPEIFKDVGFGSAREQMWGTVIVGLVNVSATFIAIAFVDKMGRKPILYAGYSIMAVCMGALGLTFHIGIGHQITQFVALASVLVFVVGFAMSAGPIIWVVCSEIYPLKGRDFGITVSTATNWTCNTVIGMTFLTLIAKIGSANTYWLYALINFAVIFILFFLVPETKGVSLEDIEANLESGKKLKNLGI